MALRACDLDVALDGGHTYGIEGLVACLNNSLKCLVIIAGIFCYFTGILSNLWGFIPTSHSFGADVRATPQESTKCANILCLPPTAAYRRPTAHLT